MQILDLELGSHSCLSGTFGNFVYRVPSNLLLRIPSFQLISA